MDSHADTEAYSMCSPKTSLFLWNDVPFHHQSSFSPFYHVSVILWGHWIISDVHDISSSSSMDCVSEPQSFPIVFLCDSLTRPTLLFTFHIYRLPQQLFHGFVLAFFSVSLLAIFKFNEYNFLIKLTSWMSLNMIEKKFVIQKPEFFSLELY